MPSSRHSSADHTSSDAQYEYSSREVSPASLLIQQLRRAYRIFLLHHSHTLSDLYVRLPRERFCDTLARYWTDFALRWDVLLHGNPAVDAFGAIKLAAGGELGIGVGEEEWGSGEREVLEGLIRNTEGMLDMVVSRYGSASDGHSVSDRGVPHTHPWLATGASPEPADGLVFSGTGHLSKHSLRDILFWANEIYRDGDHAYGIKTNPSSARRKRRRRRRPELEDEDAEDKASKVSPRRDDVLKSDASKETDSHAQEVQEHPVEQQKETPVIPPPIVSAAESSLKKATKSADSHAPANASDKGADGVSTSLGSSDVWMKYLTLGYGSSWGRAKSNAPSQPAALKDIPANQPKSTTVQSDGNPNPVAPLPVATPDDFEPAKQEKTSKSRTAAESGRYLIGLTGVLDTKNKPVSAQLADDEDDVGSNWSSRLSMRTLHVSVNTTEQTSLSSRSSSAGSITVRGRSATAQREKSAQKAKLKVVVYAHNPFLYTLLFDQECPLLTYPSFFHDLHRHLMPLQGPLLRSTSPTNVAARLQASLPQASSTSLAGNPIYDLIYGPSNITIRSTIPNIPSPGTAAAEGILSLSGSSTGSAEAWTRVEALSAHSRILDTIAETRAQRHGANSQDGLAVKPGERERNLKTSRGWWVVWTKMALTSTSESVNDTENARRASDTRPIPGSETSMDESENVEATSAIADDSIHSSQIQSGHTGSVRGGGLEREPEGDPDYKEAILIRRATDAASAGGRKSMFRTRSPPSGSASIWSQSMQGMQGMSSSAFAPFARLAGSGAQTRHMSETSPNQAPTADAEATENRGAGGIGVDVPKYIEGLLSLSR